MRLRELSNTLITASSAITPTVAATTSSISEKPDSEPRRSRSSLSRLAIVEVPHVEAVVQEDLVRVAVGALPRGRDLEGEAHELRRSHPDGLIGEGRRGHPGHDRDLRTRDPAGDQVPDALLEPGHARVRLIAVEHHATGMDVSVRIRGVDRRVVFDCNEPHPSVAGLKQCVRYLITGGVPGPKITIVPRVSSAAFTYEPVGVTPPKFVRLTLKVPATGERTDGYTHKVFLDDGFYMRNLDNG